MRKTGLFCLWLFTAALISCEEKKDTGISTEIVGSDKLPKMVFEKTSHDFGTIYDGDVVTYTFKFKNEGEGPLIISDAGSECGCTVPDYSKEPIEPGKSGGISVKFDSAGKEGKVTKKIWVIANTEPNNNELYIHVNVEPKK